MMKLSTMWKVHRRRDQLTSIAEQLASSDQVVRAEIDRVGTVLAALPTEEHRYGLFHAEGGP